MSNYPEADEAQRRHYQDGYNPYGYNNEHEQGHDNNYDAHAYQPTPANPFDNSDANARASYYSAYPPQNNAPYMPSHTPVSYQFSPPPPPPPLPLDPYGAPIHSPPPQQQQQQYVLPPIINSPPQRPFLSPPPPDNHYNAPDNANHYNAPTSDPFQTPRHSYQLQDDGVADDTGDIPLLRRDSSGSAMRLNMPMPGQYQGGGDEADDEEMNNIRYGRIPQRVPRRYKTLKKVELFHGNFVLDSQVPSKLLDLCAHKADREFTHMRYSAATCDPNDFKDSGFTLRQVHYDPPRRTELFIVMTMYNEDEELFCRTMHGVMRNIAHLTKRDRSKTWGKDGWKKVVVCIVSDGRQKINSRTLSVIAAMGAYQDGIAKNVINKKPVTAHIYEYTTQICLTPSLKIEGPEKGMVPVQIIFCLKEQNQKKINSHRWFFNAFGPILQPNVCVLLDVGTMPGVTSIYHLWKAFDINSNVGGACGEIVALKGKWGLNLINPLVAAQNFEYKMSNILDKPLESVFGYITVLPGAFSAYRYIALQNDTQGEGPLQKYFLGEKMHGAGADIFTANMYLAEDRILCWELVSKRGGSWTLHYVKSAYAITDVPDQVPEMISQRRRWLNGSFFAAVHSTVHFHYIYRSAHSFMRKFWIHVELVYQSFNLLFSWFSLANFYVAFYVLSDSLEDPTFNLKGIAIFNVILNYFYIGLLIMCFLLSLGNRPQGSKWGYTLAMVGFSLITIYMTVAAALLAYKGITQLQEEKGAALNIGDFFNNSIFFNIVLSLAATVGLYFIASFLFFEPWHMFTSFLQYMLMSPSYIGVLNVYAFANVHDVSWGTKGDNKVSTDLGVVETGGKNKNSAEVMIPTEQTDINEAYEDALMLLQTKPPKTEGVVDKGTQQEDYYRTFRTNVLLSWTLTNGLLAAVVTSTNGSASEADATATVSGYMTFLLYSVAGLALIRFIGSTTYLVVRLFAGE